jgi:hypothetical protein
MHITFSENKNGSDHLGELNIDGRVILEQI